MNTYKLSLLIVVLMSVFLQKYRNQYTITVPRQIVEYEDYVKGQEFEWVKTEDGMMLKPVQKDDKGGS